MSVLRALLYLRLTSLRNALRNRLRRLRQPKYLVGALAGAAYFWFFFFRRSGGMVAAGPAFGMMFGNGGAELIAAAVLTLFIVLIWATPGDHPGLAFTEAEVAFLFPAPLARRQLIHYKLVDGLLMSLFGALFFTLISSGFRLGWIGALRHLGAWWSFNANLSLHQTAAALTIARLSGWGLTARWRRIVILGGVAVAVAVLGYVAVERGPESLAWLLWPARLAVRPFLADSLGSYLLALLPAAGLVAAQYLWVHQMETPFEEASIVRAQKVGEALARIRSGKSIVLTRSTKARRPPFPLLDRLPPEAAFLWKNLMSTPPYLNRKVFLGLAALISFGMTWLKRQPEIDGPKTAAVAGVMALVFVIYLMLFGPQLARNDVRGDLINADMLKAYPLPGWRIVLGSILAPTLILTAIAWLLLLAAGLGLVPPHDQFTWFTPQVRFTSFSAIAVIMPALCAVQLLVPNAATLLFPAWAPHQRTPAGGGMDVMGQRLIFFFGQFVCLLVALLPAVALAGATIFLTWWLVGPSLAITLAVLPVLVVLVGEVWLGVWLIGPRFEQLDISSEMRP